MPSYAVIGGSRGIGLEYVRQLIARPDASVITVARDPDGTTYLNEAIAPGLQNVHVVAADAADAADYDILERATTEVSNVTGGKLDVPIHVAANVIMKDFDE